MYRLRITVKILLRLPLDFHFPKSNTNIKFIFWKLKNLSISIHFFHIICHLMSSTKERKKTRTTFIIISLRIKRSLLSCMPFGSNNVGFFYLNSKILYNKESNWDNKSKTCKKISYIFLPNSVPQPS